MGSKRSYKPWTLDEIARLRDDYAEGRSLQWLVREYRRNRWAIEKRLQRLNAHRPEGKRRPILEETSPRFGSTGFDPVAHDEVVRLLEPAPGETFGMLSCAY